MDVLAEDAEIHECPLREGILSMMRPPQHENSVRDLGVNLDSKLTFQIHINDIPSRANALDAIFLIWVHDQV